MTQDPVNRAGWQFYGWWGIVLPAFLVIWVTNALTLAGLNVFDAKLLAELGVERGPLKLGDTIQLLVSGALAPVGLDRRHRFAPLDLRRAPRASARGRVRDAGR